VGLSARRFQANSEGAGGADESIGEQRTDAVVHVSLAHAKMTRAHAVVSSRLESWAQDPRGLAVRHFP